MKAVDLFRPFLLTVLCICLGSSQEDVPSFQDQQMQFSCMLRDNKTMRTDFFGSVQNKHGVAKSSVRSFVVPFGAEGAMKCFSQLDCPDTNITLCLNLYHPTKQIELCLDSDNNIINMTKHAQLLGLHRHIRVADNCRSVDGYCMVGHSIPFYLDQGLLTCTSQNETCSAKDFSRIKVSVASLHQPQQESVFHNSTTKELVIDQQNIYYITTEVQADAALTFGFFSNLIPAAIYAYDNETILDWIPEDPSCNGTGECRAPSNYDYLRDNRIRVYTVNEFKPNCPVDKYVYHTWLVIDDARESDANLNFVYKSEFLVDIFPRTVSTDTIPLNLTAVPPSTNISLLRISDGVDSTTIKSTGLETGDSVQWEVSVQAVTGDRLIWTLNGEELSDATASDHIDQETLCTTYNGSYYTQESREVRQLVRNFTAILSLCDITYLHNGLYECTLVRSRAGTVQQIPVWSTEIHFPTTTTTEPTSTSAPQVLTQTEVTYIAVGVFVFLLLITVILTLVLVLVFIQMTKHRRFKSRRTSRRNDLVVQSFTNRLEMGMAWHNSESSRDEYEFPRERLFLMDKVLGKGTFGLVLLAKAQGIVQNSPDRNIVAVKTHKVSAPDGEIENLWEELQIMKKMRPHPHIVNLLGYCRETPNTSSSLYLIIEFAMYGSLQTFLRDCEEVVLSLNHIPHIAHKSGHHQSCNSCSGSTVYAKQLPQDQQSLSSVTSNTSYENVNGLTATAAGGVVGLKHQDFEAEVGNSAQATCDAVFAPVTHDYVNSKGLIYMEDVQNFALQIASGLKHLEDEKIVHCDIAARNILISEGFILKIGDFGLARDVTEKEYYRKIEGQIPVKWTAPEALEEQVFTYKSDIWSFGVLLWEIFSYGKCPFSDVKIGQSWAPFVQSLKDGTRLSKPNGCPDIFYNVMQQCWQMDPGNRPSAAALINIFKAYNEESVTPVSNCTIEFPEELDASPRDIEQIPEDEQSLSLTEVAERAKQEFTVEIASHGGRIIKSKESQV